MASRIASLLIVIVAAALLWPVWQHQRALREKAYAEIEREQAVQPAPAPPPTATQGAAPNEAPAPAPQSYYRFIDASGTLRFVDSLAKVPEEFRASARSITLGAGSSTSGTSSFSVATGRPSGARPARKPYADVADAAAAAVPAKRAAAGADVIVYTASWCPWCRKTLAWLDQRGVSYENRDIEKNPAYRRELVEKSGGTSIPVVDVRGGLIRGFDPQEMDARL